MFVLGIDPGLTTTGYGLVERRRSQMIARAVGVIRTASDLTIATRLLELHRDLEAVIEGNKPSALAIEQVFTNRNRMTATSVGRASGVIILAAAQYGLPVFEYTPTEIKSAVAGYGAAPKGQVQRLVAQRLGLADLPRPADAADALAIALCHLQTARFEERVPQ